uniref:lipoprotein n=1 Tax=Paractinoplanes polyasparticus TaxID=2856853 RepID=UPI001C841F27|nr:lipoprotein [Actinoplanes polyasparticus]
MRPPARTAQLVALAATALLLGACQGKEAAETPKVAESPKAAEAARVGAAASGCTLPVTFGLAEDWKPKAVTIAGDELLAELAQRGPMTMACEIDAKPAGLIGFLRVWTGKSGDPRANLTAFIGPEALKPVFTELQIGGRPAVEVAYEKKSQLDDAIEPEQAFVVETGQGLLAVSVDSFDSGEHKDMLPAYELAKSSLQVTG